MKIAVIHDYPDAFRKTPAYSKLKTLFAGRVELETGKKVRMPSPAWATHASGAKK